MPNPLRLRFSLLTLLLTVLLIASATTLWWNWGPWAPALTVEEDCDKASFRTVGGGRFIESHLSTFDGSDNDGLVAHHERILREVCREPNGEVKLKDWSSDQSNGPLEISDSGRFLRMNDDVYDADSGKKTSFPRAGMSFCLFKGDDWLEFPNKKSSNTIWLRLPNLKKHPFSARILTANDQWMLTRDNGGVLLYSVTESNENATPKHRWPVDGEWARFLPQGKVAIGLDTNLFIYDVESGKLLKQITNKSGILKTDSAGKFLFIFNSEEHATSALWQLDPEVKLLHTFDKKRVEFDPILTEQNILTDVPLSVIDIKSGKTLWSKPEYGGTFSHDHCLVSCYQEESILETNTGKTVFTFSRRRWPKLLSVEKVHMEFLNDPTMFMTIAKDPPRFTIWKLTRPYEWYGPACLPEFWLTLLLALALIYSIASHRRRRKNDKSPMTNPK